MKGVMVGSLVIHKQGQSLSATAVNHNAQAMASITAMQNHTGTRQHRGRNYLKSRSQ